ncbi:MAG: DNA repair protein RadC [Verrucomicrobiota bacterium]
MKEDASPASGHRARLRQRFLQSGFAGFADHEIIELLLTLCIPRKDVKPQAKALLKRFGSIKAVLDAPLTELQTVEGLGEVAPVALHIVRDTASLYLQQKAMDRPLLDGIEPLIKLWRTRLGGLQHEVFEVAYLDKRFQLLPGGIERLEEGVADQTRVYPGKVVRSALTRNAVFIVIAHNHPSGQLKVSTADRALTQRLAEAAKAVELTLLDHIIVTPDDALSFIEEGLLPAPS